MKAGTKGIMVALVAPRADGVLRSILPRRSEINE
jgi:hypothetical protein